MLGFLRQMEYASWVESEKQNHKTAKSLGKTECLRCGLCCLRRPCLPTPAEVEKIAEFFNLTFEQTIRKYFVVDSFETGGTKFAFPAKETQQDITGTYIDFDRTFDRGYCIFYDRKKRICKIHSVQPEQAKITCCWIDNDEAQEKLKEETLKKWEKVNLDDFT